MAIKYDVNTDTNYGLDSERLALTLSAANQNYKFYSYDTGTLYIWSGSQWYSMS